MLFLLKQAPDLLLIVDLTVISLLLNQKVIFFLDLDLERQSSKTISRLFRDINGFTWQADVFKFLKDFMVTYFFMF